MPEALSLALGYLLGSIDFAVLTARRRGVDIYSAGSGNPGASNVSRILGRGLGAAVFGADLLKGVGAAAFGELVGGSELVGFLAGGMAVLGHCFPVWHRFRGGKGVATTVGVLLWSIPGLGLALAALWALIVGVTKIASFGSLTIVVAAIPAVAVLAEDAWSAAVMAAISALVILRHQGNIRRMIGSGEQTL